MYRSLLTTAIVAAVPLTHAGTQVPDECQLEQGAIPGKSATMACYAALDHDGDGALTADEASALPRLANRIEALDRDGSGTLSPDEFQAEMTTPAQRAGGKGI